VLHVALLCLFHHPVHNVRYCLLHSSRRHAQTCRSLFRSLPFLLLFSVFRLRRRVIRARFSPILGGSGSALRARFLPLLGRTGSVRPLLAFPFLLHCPSHSARMEKWRPLGRLFSPDAHIQVAVRPLRLSLYVLRIAPAFARLLISRETKFATVSATYLLSETFPLLTPTS